MNISFYIVVPWFDDVWYRLLYRSTPLQTNINKGVVRSPKFSSMIVPPPETSAATLVISDTQIVVVSYLLTYLVNYTAYKIRCGCVTDRRQAWCGSWARSSLWEATSTRCRCTGRKQCVVDVGHSPEPRQLYTGHRTTSHPSFRHQSPVK